MNRFGSIKLRITWLMFFLIVSIIFFIGIPGVNSTSNNLVFFGIEIPFKFYDFTLRSYIIQTISTIIYTIVTSIMVICHFMSIRFYITSKMWNERCKGLIVGLMHAIFHGIFLSQMALLPLFIVAYRLLGNRFELILLQNDVNAICLGAQLLSWTILFGIIVESNFGLPVILAYGLNEVSQVLSWCDNFLYGLQINNSLSFVIHVIIGILPISRPLAYSSLLNFLLRLCLPIGLSMLMLLVTNFNNKYEHSIKR